MSAPIFRSAISQKYHHGMLIVRMRPSIRRAATALNAAPSVRSSIMSSPGLSTMEAMERGGLIKSVRPLSANTDQQHGAPAVRRMTLSAANAFDDRTDNDLNKGVSIVELERDDDVAALQTAFANDPDVEYVSRVPIRYILLPPSKKKRRTRGANATAAAAAPPPSLWNLRKIRWSEARSIESFHDADRIKVAVLDTGIDDNHPDLTGRVSTYTYHHPDLPVASSNRDIVGHGTHVAGTICSAINNGVGINGICNCDLRAWKIFDDVVDYDPFFQTFAYYVDPILYLRALADCVDQKVNVVNLSIGGGGTPDQHEQQLFDELLANGTTIVAAMGNERREGSPTSYPAAIPGVIAVGATGIDDSIANFSNRGNHISLVAPGVGIWSTLPTYPGQFGFDAEFGPGGTPVEGRPNRRETQYDSWPGTSMATPHVAGAAALLLANNGLMSGSDVKTRLQATADKVAGMDGREFDSDFGAGRLNLLNLLQN